MNDSRLQVFISSKMRRNALRAEREAARNAVKALGFADAWDWETCGYADCRPPMQICLQAVRRSDVLVLLVGRDLTSHTKAEHREAIRCKKADFIFVKRCSLKPETRNYLHRQGKRCTYQVFRSPQELTSGIQLSIWNHLMAVYRSANQPEIGTRHTSGKQLIEGEQAPPVR